MKLVILSRNRFLYSTRRLASAAQASGHDVVIADPKRCQIKMSAPIEAWSDQELLSDADVVIPRLGTTTLDAGLRTLEALEAHGIRCVNSSPASSLSADKYRSLLKLENANIPAPPSLLIHKGFKVESLEGQLGPAPWVFKTLKGSQGVGVVLAESMPSATSICDALFEHHDALLAQPYLRDKTRDLRVFVIGDEVVACIERQARKNDFRANVHRGAKATAIEASQEIRELGLAAAKAMGLEIAGVDILKSDDGPYVIDVNASPGLEGVEQASGIDIASKIIQHVCDGDTEKD